MKKTTVNLCLSIDGSWTKTRSLSWPAYQTETPGLVVHRAIKQDESPAPWWNITHAPSGLNVTCKNFDTRKEAATVASNIGSLFDWTQGADIIVNTTGLLAAVSKAARQGT